MYKIVPTKDYIKSYKKFKHSGQFGLKVQKKLEFVIDSLAGGRSLPPIYKDHQLVGDLKDYRDCHIKGDLLLIYQIRNKELILVLVNIGTHSELF